MAPILDRRLGAPILTYPALSLNGKSISDVLLSHESQAEAILAAARRVKIGAAFCFMDLSAEAEAFGARVKLSGDSIPRVVPNRLNSLTDIMYIRTPDVGAARTGIYLKCARLVAKSVLDRPAYACVCGPYTVAWQLVGAEPMREICRKNPRLAEALLEKILDFQVGYVDAYKRAGMSGVLLAEPLAGFLEAEPNWRFSGRYVKRLVDREQSSDFSVIYHSCADRAENIAGQIFKTGACAFHFGETSDIEKILSSAPRDVLVMGNLRALDFAEKTPEYIAHSTKSLLQKLGKFENYVVSSGCDIPKSALWENIDAFCDAVRLYYK